ncbi:nucleoside 2-deoxyribosyltransferase [Ilyobacter polytropus]|uniref:Putative 2'-deoxynucleoside 5'-phosphate N-hydrolase 1 n=1 Tax=Ilyobacter polytropus (strain ATCC 51220 / DSM 2926 / LMG 16218 / CuHBu1) TaxID=572544 RepID=E3HAG0_ILYPC|nr:nucleoside 2-deoxyribosyltransferase [Ilyobacter polytropus]ADO82034.1 nucleoside 2-deoxyribosyltransferase [Ilyobacter polytropus DSM 2926]
MKKIYFAGSIRGGRENMEIYAELIEFLSNYGTVLTEHVGYKDLEETMESEKSDFAIYDQDIAWLRECDLVVAEVSQPSIGVGYEIGIAESLGKKILCLYNEEAPKRLSAMLAGNEKISTCFYNSIEHAKRCIEGALKNL